jgi:arylsulfatase A-like enzyme
LEKQNWQLENLTHLQQVPHFKTSSVVMLVSNPHFSSKTVTSPVETIQIAPTILKALGLDPWKLDAVRKEGTQALPDIKFDFDDWK